MTSTHRASITRFLTVVFVIAGLAVAAQAADPATPRAFAPVQDGFVPDAARELPYHPSRILVKFRAESLAQSLLELPGDPDKANDQTPARTGLGSVDALLAQTGVTAIERPWIEMKQVELAGRLGLDRWYLLQTDGLSDPLRAAQRLSKDPHVESAQVDWRAFPAAVPGDPLHSINWGHNNTAQMLSFDWSAGAHTGPAVGTVGFDANAHAAWDESQGYGSAGVVIAILDSGVEVGHPDLRQVAGYDYGDNDSNPDDNSSQPGHGTACAGVAASMANSLGAAGMAPGCSIMPLKVANSAGSMYFSSIQNALYHAADNGADIISMSLGAAISSDGATDTAILYAYNAGCTILAATGNENASTISYPAINAYVIGVGAASPCGERKRSSSSSGEVNPGVSTDPNGYTCDGERWWGSNYGSTVQDNAGAVDVIAPTILPTTDLLGSAGYDSSDYSKWFNGTSCSTPYAAGLCALIKSQNPSWTPAQIRDRLVDTAEDVTSVESGVGFDRYTGYGMVDAAAALGGGSPPVDSVTVTSPNGGETLTAGAVWTITWTSSGTFSTVAIEYSTNGGSVWNTITSSTTDDGSYGWTVPSSATTQGRVRISGGTAQDTSNNNFTIDVPTGGDYASLPYSTGFESGSLDQYWTTASTVDGRVRILSTNTPHTGSYHLTMDDPTSGGYAQNEAWLHLDLAGESQVDLAFWWKEFGDETHSQDGVYFSDNGGSSFVKVQDLAGSSTSNNTWGSFDLDLDALAAANGLSLTGTFVVKFQQYDNYPIATDGFAFDDIEVTAGGAPPTGDYASLPYSTGFESGSLDQYWTTASSSDGRVRILSTNTPHSGSYHLTMDDPTSGGYVTNEAWLHLDLAGESQVDLAFWWKEFGDETHAADGVYFSDDGGASFSKVQNLNGQSYTNNTWQSFDLDLDALAAGAGVSLTGTFVVKFQQYDNYPMTTDGFAFDDIAVTTGGGGGGTAITAESEPNGDSGTADGPVGDAVAVSGVISSSSDDDWFWFDVSTAGNINISVAIGSSADLDWFLYNSSLTQVARGYTVSNPEAGSYNASAGRYYLRVDGYNGATSSYTLTVGGGLAASDSGIEKQDLPRVYSLGQNLPNPFNPATMIEYAVPSEGRVTVRVYDPRGRMITTLVDKVVGIGRHQVTWDGRDAQGRRVHSGVYLYVIEANDFRASRKMTLVK